MTFPYVFRRFLIGLHVNCQTKLGECIVHLKVFPRSPQNEMMTSHEVELRHD